ncbi:MAG: hypothetical protein WBM40_24740 [Thiohalocapsa sp.]
MIIDNLTLAGLVVSSLFALMPVMMGREFIRVRESDKGPHPIEEPHLDQPLHHARAAGH